MNVNKIQPVPSVNKSNSGQVKDNGNKPLSSGIFQQLLNEQLHRANKTSKMLDKKTEEKSERKSEDAKTNAQQLRLQDSMLQSIIAGQSKTNKPNMTNVKKAYGQ